MKERIIGIDAGTNSLGWAIVDYDKEAETDKYTLIDKGVKIFQEGVKIEKGIESSRAAERTEHKHQRVGYWRRKCRKIRLLAILSNHNLCPPLSKDELHKWRAYKIYPQNEAFINWQRTDEEENKNPYFYRNLCLTESLDMTDLSQRYIVGRAIYHINQRRGFLSNRKEDTKAADGAVITGISDITAAMVESGCEYLGQYFYKLYQTKERIRAHYTHRIDHYEKELLAICEKQGLSEELTKDLRKTIITQRPLKSQKQSVGKCVFEKKKARCPQSHPLFEQYRMYAFINNIKVQTPRDESLRQLTAEEKQLIIPLFLRKSKADFQFSDIAKKLSGSKNNFCYYKSHEQKGYRFNYYMDTTVSGCPVIAQLSDAFEVKDNEDSWLEAAIEQYTLGGGKNRYEILNDIWHALFSFEDYENLKAFAMEKLQLDEEHAEIFSKIKMPQDYASLSLKAIRKILPYMKEYGLIFSHAVFFANLPYVVDIPVNKEALLPMLPKADADELVAVFNEYDEVRKQSGIELTKDAYVKTYILRKYNLADEDMKKLNNLYHPSMVETFPKVTRPTENGYFQLGSPRTGSVRNPMAMRSLFRLRHIINTLLAKGKIDKDDTIHIEFARELNDSNKRAAIRDWQRDRENKRKEYAERIAEFKGNGYAATENDIDLYEKWVEQGMLKQSKNDILRYELWEEQEHICPYTGKRISLSDLFDDSNKFDIEHTIPRSVGGDSTEANLTLCDAKFNREIKRAQMPSQLANHEEILERIAPWKEKYEDLEKQIRKINTRGVADKAMKDRMIQKRHRLTLERDYWRGKYERFTMTEVPEGFARRQGVDISVISRYSRLYLKSLFRNVNIVKGIATSDFRKIWGIQDEYEKKARVNHCHHAIDAITIACIGSEEYKKLAEYYHDDERRRWGMDSKRASFPKPWRTFTEDVKQIEQSLIVSHYTADNMPKHTKKRIRGTKDKYMQGDTARGSLHMDTFYGAIQQGDKLCYVVRKPLDMVDPKNIVDEGVKLKVLEAIAEHGNLKKAVEAGVWMNKEKGIRINKVRVYQKDVTQPLSIRVHRDVSAKEHKRNVFVKNDSNYLAAVYEGKNAKGKIIREFLFYNNLEAARHFRKSGGERELSVVPEKSENGLKLKYILKTGTMLLLYEDTPEEIYEASKMELQRRLYKITIMEATNKRLILTHQQEARPGSEVPIGGGAYKQNEEFRYKVRIMINQLNALIEGQDFRIDEDGEIIFLHR